MFLLDGGRSGRWRWTLCSFGTFSALRTLCPFRTLRPFGTLYPFRTLGSLGTFGPLWALRTLGTFRALSDRLRRANDWLRETIDAIAIAAVGVAVRALITLTAAETALALIVIAFAAMRTPVVAVAVVATEILPVVAIVPVVPLLVAPIVAIVIAIVVEALVPRLAVFVAVLIVEVARLLRERRLLRIGLLPSLATELRLTAELVAFLVTELIAVRTLGPGERMRASGPVTHGVDATLLRHLFAIAEDDAIVVFRVLQVILSQHRIARRQRVTRQRYVLFSDVRGRAADFHIGPRALETAHQGILRFAVIVIIIVVVVSTATATVLLTLPHGLPFMLVDTLPPALADRYAAPWILRSNSISRF
ncbi:hypothetical protein HYPP_04497 [Hyphomicrobium sp. ghe19]|nr:hypothetical protein HYPP_04497 [Hyphomicrobium sp. ghe19]